MVHLRKHLAQIPVVVRSGMGHGKQRDFVKDYWHQLEGNTVAAASNN